MTDGRFASHSIHSKWRRHAYYYLLLQMVLSRISFFIVMRTKKKTEIPVPAIKKTAIIFFISKQNCYKIVFTARTASKIASLVFQVVEYSNGTQFLATLGQNIFFFLINQDEWITVYPLHHTKILIISGTTSEKQLFRTNYLFFILITYIHGGWQCELYFDSPIMGKNYAVFVLEKLYGECGKYARAKLWQLRKDLFRAIWYANKVRSKGTKNAKRLHSFCRF